MEFIRLFQAGGPVMYLLLLCSIISVTIAVERFIYYLDCKMKCDS